MINTFPSKEVTILDNNYQVNCPIGEEESLNQAITFLNQQLNEVRKIHQNTNNKNLLAITALNMASNLLECQDTKNIVEKQLGEKLNFLNDKIKKSINHTQKKFGVTL